MNQDLLFSVYTDSVNQCKNSAYMVELNGFHLSKNKQETILTELKKMNTFHIKKIKTSQSKDGRYKKESGQLFEVKKKCQVNPICLQNKVSLHGYGITEKMLNTSWANENRDEVKIDYKQFTKEVEKCFFYTKEIFFYFSPDNIMIKFNNPTISLVIQYINVILGQLFLNYSFILTLEEEMNIKKYEIINVINELQTLWKASYCNTKQVRKSMIIKNYFDTIPCIRFNVNKEVFLIDIYDNIVKIDNTDKEDYDYIDEGFSNDKHEFVMIENLDFHFKMESTDALIYYDDTDRSYEIYTHPANIYIDEIVNGIFTRTNYLQITKENLFISEKGMDKDKINRIRHTLTEVEIRRIVNHFYSDFNIEHLRELKGYLIYREMITKECEKKGEWFRDFFINFLNITYDEKKPIIFKIEPTQLSSIKINNCFISLDDDLEREKVNIDIFHNYHLNKEKSDYYNLSIKFLDKMKLYSKEVQKKVHISGSITNAWMKCWEMIHVFELVPKNHSNFTIFCNAEFPGAFILALNHFIKTETSNKQYEWYANSLWPTDDTKHKEIFKDHFKLYEKYKNRWLMTPENKGDITDLKMIKIIEDRLSEKVDLYTSDIGTGVEENQEINETIYNLGQVICGLKTLKDGGTMVCKMFTFFKPFNISLLKQLSKVFKEFYITKPMASRPANSEIYVIGKGYTKNQDIIDLLVQYLIDWKEETVYDFIEPISEDFYLKTVYMLYYIYERQIYFLKKNMCFVKALYEKKINKFFQIFKIQSLKDQVDDLSNRQGIVDEWKNIFPIPFLEKRDDL